MKVALFVTCLVDQFRPEVGVSAARVLRRLGVEVTFDERQTCCGQPAANAGYVSEARQVFLHSLEVVEACETVVALSGSCASLLKHGATHLFRDDSETRRRAEVAAKKVFEFSEYLDVVLERVDVGARFAHKVTYHDSCHLLRELGIRESPRRLIRAVEGLDFVEMKDSSVCCGFGGLFSADFPSVSEAIANDKIDSAHEAGAEWIVANDLGCLMHLDGVIRKRSLPIRTMHLAELLAQGHD